MFFKDYVAVFFNGKQEEDSKNVMLKKRITNAKNPSVKISIENTNGSRNMFTIRHAKQLKQLTDIW